ncbi:hypothetical protein GUITHDRAFT_60861, partial [Guillardia theta CCMP2712]
LARAIRHVHGMGVIHRDVKPANVLVKKNGVVKLSDFGEARLLSSDQQAMTLVGTNGFIAPEICKGLPYGSACDVYSFGCTLLDSRSG